MRIIKEQGLILRRTHTGEADHLLTIFTKESGKLRVIAKGTRKITSRRGGHIDLFNIVSCTIREGNGLPYLEEVKVLRTLVSLKNDWEGLADLYYVAELIDLLVPDGASDEYIYQMLILYIGKILSLSGEQKEMASRTFEVNLLKHLGNWSEVENGANYPKSLKAQKQYNQQLIQTLTQRPLHTKRLFG